MTEREWTNACRALETYLPSDELKERLAGLCSHVLHLRHEIERAVNAECSCGGRGPDDDPCQACAIWHRVRPLLEEETKHV